MKLLRRVLWSCIPQFSYFSGRIFQRFSTVAGEYLFKTPSSGAGCFAFCKVGDGEWRIFSGPVVVHRGISAIRVYFIAVGWRGIDRLTIDVESLQTVLNSTEFSLQLGSHRPVQPVVIDIPAVEFYSSIPSVCTIKVGYNESMRPLRVKLSVINGEDTRTCPT